ncbi:MAG: tetratricopeptide repeat protein [Pseudomonadales bacterium]|nr:tetratricopeptide repeat protein [Pseudomonadales bacterium]
MLQVSCDNGSNSARNLARHIESGQAYLEQGQFSAAIIEAQTVLNEDPKSEVANVLLAEIYLRLSMSRRASEVLEMIQGKTQKYYRLLSESYIEQGKYGTALNILRQQSALFEKQKTSWLILRARALIGLKNITSAEEDYRQALKLEPGSIEVQLGLVRIRALNGRLDLAEQDLSRLLEKHPQSLEGLLMIAAVYMRQGRLERAEITLTDAFSVLPVTDIFTRQRADLLRNLIRLLAFQGRSGEALIYQQMLADAFPNGEEINGRMDNVSVRLQSGDFDSALQLLDEIDSISPGNDTTGTLRGLIAFLRGDDAVAQDLFVENIDLEIATPKMLELFAANQFRLNQPHRVVKMLRPKIENTQNADLLALFGVAALSADREEEGMDALRRAIALVPDRVRLVVIYAQQMNYKDPEGALDQLNSAHGRKPDDMVVRFSLLNQYLAMGRDDDAAKFVNKVVEGDKLNYTSYLLAGSLAIRVEDTSAAAVAFETAIKLAPADEQGYLGLAEARFKEKRYEAAAALFETAIEKNLDSLHGYNGLLNTYVVRGQDKAGVERLVELAEEQQVSIPLAVISGFYAGRQDVASSEDYISRVKPTSGSEKYWRRVNATVQIKRALARLKAGEYGEARTSIFAALSSFPAKKEFLGLLVEVEIAADSLVEARKVVDQLALMHPGSRIYFMRHGDLAVAENDSSSARSSYEAAWQIKEGDQLGLSLYQVYLDLGQVTLAGNMLSEWRKAIPYSVVATIQLAEKLVGENRTQQAIEVYQSFITTIGSSVVENNLAWLYIEVDRIDEALALSNKNYQKLKNDGAAADTYGWALYKANRTVEAVEILSRAFKLLPDPRIKDHLLEAKNAAGG